MYIGFDHFNNGIPHKDLQIGCHRIDHKISWGLSDNDLKHQLLYGMHNDDFYTRSDINLDKFLTDCKTYNVIPIVNNNGYYQDNMPIVSEYARRCRIINDILKERGLLKAYISIMNEPNTATGFNTVIYTNIVNECKKVIKDYPVIAGNDEFGNLDWNYLLDNGKFDVLGVHPLSSLGYPANWNRLSDWATMATARGKKYIITEGGSWFKSYFSLEGFTVIKNMILKAKFYGYEAVCIVALDNNGATNPNLGFRRFNYNYSKLLETSPYWQDFINLVNREGKKYQSEIIIINEDNDMKLKNLKEGSTGNQVRFLQEILMLEYGFPNEFENPFDGKFGKFTDKQVRAYQEHIANNLEVDGCVGINTMTDLILEVDRKPVEDRKFSTNYWFKKLQIYMAYE